MLNNAFLNNNVRRNFEYAYVQNLSTEALEVDPRQLSAWPGFDRSHLALGYLMDHARALVPYVQCCCPYEVYKYTCEPIAVLSCEAIAVSMLWKATVLACETACPTMQLMIYSTARTCY